MLTKYNFALSHHLSARGTVTQAVLMNLALGNTDRMSKFETLLAPVCRLVYCLVFVLFIIIMI